MSIFGRIMDKIFGNKKAEAREAPAPQQGQFSPQAQVQPQQGGTATSPRTPMQTVDVEKVLSDMADKNPQKLNWRTSIVDLMKLLDLESSLTERKELAQELGYKGDMNDSATMNIWLHKQVMQKLAQNGGKVPPELMN